VIGLVALALVVVIVIAVAGYYVYQVRSGQGSVVATPLSLKKNSTPKEVVKDADASAADVAGKDADNENLDDLNLSESDLR
jgi:hypothetical protein